MAEQEKQRHQQQLAHVMRLSTMGEMASGMAHELNQPLTALISYCGTAVKMAENTPSLPEGYIEILHRAEEQAHRAGDVIRHLREFTSKSSDDRSRVVLEELVQRVIDFISWELRDNGIRLDHRPDVPGCEVYVDKIQIEQVILNLIRNSIEAIRQAGITGGRLDIRTRPAAGNSIMLSIADNGPGIDPAMADSLFEPYQTNKENGMGMGLSISRSIVEAHGGKLWANMDAAHGALFCMKLPLCD
jgi:two-component system sensor histidine kinase TtrS